MKFLGLSGSLRAESTNSALLQALARMAPASTSIQVFDGLDSLPAFNPDREGALTPAAVLRFAAAIANADGLIVSCPEYVHAIPGAFKNALDWLVSRDTLIGKPIALIHASHRGDDVLADLRRVLATVTDRFAPDIFAQFPLRTLAPDAVAAAMEAPAAKAEAVQFLTRFADFVDKR